MPLPYLIYPEYRLVHVRGRGVLTAEAVIQHLEALAADPHYVAPMRKLIDYRNVDMSGFDFNAVRRVAAAKEALEVRFQGERNAFIVGSDLTFGLSRQHQSLMNDTEVQVGVFRNFEDAAQWLELPVPESVLLAAWEASIHR